MSSETATSDADSDWALVFEGYDPADEGRRESVCALGNGMYIARAADPSATADQTHYPGTYRAGCYNRLVSEVNDDVVDDESTVNLPNWLPLTFRAAGGAWFALDAVDVLNYRQILDLRRGLVLRELRFRDGAGRHTTLRETRLVSMEQPNLAALRWELTAEDWGGELEVRAGIDGRVVNDQVERFRPYSKRHLEITGAGAEEGVIWLGARTTQSQIAIAVAARTTLGGAPEVQRSVVQEAEQIAEQIRATVEQGATVVVEKTVALVTSRDPAIDESGATALRLLSRAPGFAELRAAHARAWERLWSRCEMDIRPAELLLPLRLRVFHLLQTISPHSENLDVGLPSRGWNGEEYRGQIFWDELFVFPVLAARFPALARQLLLYRYHRLDEARHMARASGRAGAMFPWRSASTGREETPTYQFNLLSGGWYRDNTRLQRHIGAAIAYNVWTYTMITADVEFLADYGAELVVQIARFWASAVTHNPDLDRYEIRGVVGPDEYHTTYPDADEPGLRNNSYTNLMAAWTLARVPELLRRLPDERRAALLHALSLTPEELARWDTISRRMQLIFDEDEALSQFEGFDRLRPFDIERFGEEHAGQPADWVLMAQGDDINRYQVAKQADVAVAAYLLTPAELVELVERQGYRFDEAALRRTLDRALAHTIHDSSLSRNVYAGALAALDSRASWAQFAEVLPVDMEPCSESTAIGLHLGAMVGTLGVLQQHYLGVRFRDDGIHLDPALPDEIAELRVCVHFRGGQVGLGATRAELEVSAAETNDGPVRIVVRGEPALVPPGASVRVAL